MDLELPRYQCHKIVQALKIEKVIINWGVITLYPEVTTLYPEDPQYTPIVVDSTFFIKHNPHDGGYYVVYEDGYKSFSPAKAFEEGYTLINETKPGVQDA